MTGKRISPAALHALKEALTVVFWYKTELRAFLATALDDRPLVASLDWTQYKRSIVSQLVDSLAASQPRTLDQLVELMFATVDVGDPVHLKKLDDKKVQYEQAVAALAALRTQVEPYRQSRAADEEARQSSAAEEARAEIRRAITSKLAELRHFFLEIVVLPPQERGYKLEKLLTDLFAMYDIDAKGPFRVTGEQIDGAFTFEGTEFLLKAKWEKDKTPLSDLDVFSSKVGRKLDNTLGLFVAMNGFQQTAVDQCSGKRSVIILMDGSDLSAIVEDRISLPELLTRKRQHAARTGHVMLSAYEC